MSYHYHYQTESAECPNMFKPDRKRTIFISRPYNLTNLRRVNGLEYWNASPHRTSSSDIQFLLRPEAPDVLASTPNPREDVDAPYASYKEEI